jgi:hypothetical protein
MLRSTDKRLHAELETQFFDYLLGQSLPIYTKYESMVRFLSMIQAVDGLGERVKALELVSEGLRGHEYGSQWAWEDLCHREQVDIAEEDFEIINKLDADHALATPESNGFLHTGGYRTILGQIINACLNLQDIDIRGLRVSCIPRSGLDYLLTYISQADEHIPGWTDATKFRELSFYRPGLDYKPIFYGDWQYDTVHLRVTHYTDEFGEDIIEPNAGPQACFEDDVDAAVLASGKELNVNVIG